MKKSLTLLLVATLALGIGFAYASPMLINPMNVQPYPNVPQGPKADFSLDVVYANFDSVKFQNTQDFHNQDGSLNHTETHPAVNVTYNVVVNVTNTADTPATLYEVTFAAGQNIKAQDSILGGKILDSGFKAGSGDLGAYKHFGAIVDGVYLDGKWVNVTWMPQVTYDYNGENYTVPYPENLFSLTQTSWHSGIISGPLAPEQVEAYSKNHNLNSSIPELPANASKTGTWFEGVPITEYYSQTGTPMVTMMYINGGWVDVTGKVSVDHKQPMVTVNNLLVNEVETLGAQPYQNMNATVGPVTSLPNWGDWGTGNAYFWLPWDWAKQPFNNVFAPHESRLISFNNTQLFILLPDDAPPTQGVAALQTGNIALYVSASNYLSNTPINGTFHNTMSTASKIADLQLEKTDSGYVYNRILGENQTFVQVSKFEVKVASETQP